MPDMPKQWKPLVRRKSDSPWIGLTESGQWVCERQPDGVVEITENNPISLLSLLELDQALIKEQIQKGLGQPFASSGVMFPFDWMLKAGLRSGSEYWESLALDWLERELNPKLADELDRLKNEAKTQKHRHRAMKLAKQCRE